MKKLLVGLLMCGACTHAEEASKPASASSTATTPASTAGSTAGAPEAGGPAWAKVLLPPAEVGGHRFAVEGCAAQAGGGEAVTRSAPTGSAEETGDKVAVSGLSGGFVLSHALDHTCCLKADSKVEVSGQKVTITEQFSGNACRCRCRSTLKTAVGLGQGTFEVEVKVSDAGGTRSAYTGQVVVK